MKIAIISDTHFGVRNDSPIFLNYSLDYFENIFFPYLQENNIQNVIHMGDLLDRRKYVNFNTLGQVRTRFMNKFDEYGITLHITLGNHDVFYKNSNHVNSIKELFSSSQSHFTINPSVSIDVSVKLTASGAKLLLLSTTKEACGGLLAGGAKTSIDKDFCEDF